MNSINLCFDEAMAMHVHVRTAGMLQAQWHDVLIYPRGNGAVQSHHSFLWRPMHTHEMHFCGMTSYDTNSTCYTLIALSAGLPPKPASTSVFAAVSMPCNCSKVLLAYVCQRDLL
jgi:hypothetical protein